MPSPPTQILQHFRLTQPEPLGGRLNKHWRVQRGAEVLVLRRWSDAETPGSTEWEREARKQLTGYGWPVPHDISEVYELAGARWSLMSWRPGTPRPDRNASAELRARGRLLAEFHLATAAQDLPQRPGWRTARDTLHDPQVEKVFAAHANAKEAHLLLWHWHKARERLLEVGETDPPRFLHGDFTPWNLLFEGNRLSGLLDFEFARLDERVVDFALSWRGAYDELIHAYHEVSPLSDAQRHSLTPLWWGTLLEGAYRDLQRGVQDDGWTVRMLLRRSPLMPVEAYS